MDIRCKALPTLCGVRNERGFSQRELTLLINAFRKDVKMSNKLLTKVEAGDRTCSLLQAQVIARVLGRATSSLFEVLDI